MELVFCDTETFDSILDKLCIQNPQRAPLAIPSVFATHLPRNFTEINR